MSFLGEGLNEAQSIYTITVDSPDIGIEGTLTLRSSALAHYPCSLAKTGQSEEVIPHLGWANAHPDAEARTEFLVNGTKISFTRMGYHDKNWAAAPIGNLVQSWYWGNAR